MGGALAARSGLRALNRAGVKVTMPNINMPSFGGGFQRNTLKGFETPMTRAEARHILNLAERNPGKDVIKETHRRLLVANPPDKGGSTYLASKINEAKDVMLGKKSS